MYKNELRVFVELNDKLELNFKLNMTLFKDDKIVGVFKPYCHSSEYSNLKNAFDDNGINSISMKMLKTDLLEIIEAFDKPVILKVNGQYFETYALNAYVHPIHENLEYYVGLYEESDAYKEELRVAEAVKTFEDVFEDARNNTDFTDEKLFIGTEHEPIILNTVKFIDLDNDEYLFNTECGKEELVSYFNEYCHWLLDSHKNPNELCFEYYLNSFKKNIETESIDTSIINEPITIDLILNLDKGLTAANKNIPLKLFGDDEIEPREVPFI